MSLHPSLKTSTRGKKHRTVLKRYERYAALKEKGILKEEDSIFGMPKLKIMRIKIKKEKAEEKPSTEQAAGVSTGETPSGTPAKEPKAEKEKK